MKSSANESRPIPELDLPAIVARCRADPALMAELADIYAQADRAAKAAGNTCMGGGMCCKFDLFDHRLYLSLAELAMLTIEPPTDPARARQQRCPYQKGPICTAYSRRPLGCRIFCCRGAPTRPATDTYEKLHMKIRLLHQTRWVPYAYAELTSLMLQLFSSP